MLFSILVKRDLMFHLNVEMGRKRVAHWGTRGGGYLLVAVRLLFVGINAYRIYPVAMRCLHVDTRVRVARSLTLYRNFMHFGPDEYGFVAVAPRRVVVDLCGRFVSPIDRAVHPRIAEKCTGRETDKDKRSVSLEKFDSASRYSTSDSGISCRSDMSQNLQAFR